MATIRKMGKKWQAVIRIKKRQLSKSFEKKSDAVKWSAKVEYEIEQGVFNNSDRLNSSIVSLAVLLRPMFSPMITITVNRIHVMII